MCVFYLVMVKTRNNSLCVLLCSTILHTHSTHSCHHLRKSFIHLFAFDSYSPRGIVPNFLGKAKVPRDPRSLLSRLTNPALLSLPAPLHLRLQPSRLRPRHVRLLQFPNYPTYLPRDRRKEVPGVFLHHNSMFPQSPREWSVREHCLASLPLGGVYPFRPPPRTPFSLRRLPRLYPRRTRTFNNRNHLKYHRNQRLLRRKKGRLLPFPNMSVYPALATVQLSWMLPKLSTSTRIHRSPLVLPRSKL